MEGPAFSVSAPLYYKSDEHRGLQFYMLVNGLSTRLIAMIVQILPGRPFCSWSRGMLAMNSIRALAAVMGGLERRECRQLDYRRGQRSKRRRTESANAMATCSCASRWTFDPGLLNSLAGRSAGPIRRDVMENLFTPVDLWRRLPSGSGTRIRTR